MTYFVALFAQEEIPPGFSPQNGRLDDYHREHCLWLESDFTIHRRAGNHVDVLLVLLFLKFGIVRPLLAIRGMGSPFRAMLLKPLPRLAHNR